MTGERPAYSWKEGCLADIARPQRPRANPVEHADLPFIGMEQVEAHTMRLLGTVPARAMKSSAFHFQPGDVLYGRLRPYLNKVLRARFEGLCSAEFIPLTVAAGVDARFVQYLLNSSDFVSFASHRNEGDRPRVGFNDIAAYPVAVPPQVEQVRIVDAIESALTRLDAAVESLTRAEVQLRRCRASLLKAAVSGRLTHFESDIEDGGSLETAAQELASAGPNARPLQRRGVPERVEMPAAAAAVEVPPGWAIKSVAALLRSGALVDVKDGNHGSNHPKRAEFSSEGLPFIMASQVRDFGIDYDAASRVSGEPLERLRVGFAQVGDVILTHKGSIGRVALCDRDCVLTPQTTYYRVNDAVLDRRYLMYHHASPFFFSQLAEVKSQTTRDYVPISRQYALHVLVPPFREQIRIARALDFHFSLVDDIERCVKNELARCIVLRQAVIKAGLEGRLTECLGGQVRQSSGSDRSAAERSCSAKGAQRDGAADDR